MKSFSILLFLLVMTVNAARQLTREVSSISISVNKANNPIITRQPSTELSSTMSNVQEKGQEIKMTDGGTERSNIKDVEGGESEGSNEGDGLVYNVDYHGVTTHPSPSPKHPKP